MIFINVDDWGLMWTLANNSEYDLVYRHHLHGKLVTWRFRAWCFNQDQCWCFDFGSQSILRGLKLLGPDEDIDHTGLDLSQMSLEARDKTLAYYWGPMAREALVALDLSTLGDEGDVIVPDWRGGL